MLFFFFVYCLLVIMFFLLMFFFPLGAWDGLHNFIVALPVPSM